MLLPIAFALVTTVTGTDHTPVLRPVGDRVVSLTPLLCGLGEDCVVELVDLAHRPRPEIITVHAARGALEARFAHRTPPANAVGRLASLDATLVSYTPTRAGFLFSDSSDEPGRAFWYGELDARTGAIVGAAKIADQDALTDAYIVGVDDTDPAHRAAWFYVEHYRDPHRPAEHYTRAHSATSVDFVRVDLGTLAVTTPATLALPARAQHGVLGDALFVHHAGDFTRFAVAEYDEGPRHLSPAAQVYIVDARAGTSFSVAIPEVVYAVTFAPDGRFAYLSSAVSGEVARIDLAAQQIDRRVRGPVNTHDAVISPDGTHLRVLASARSYVEYDLPELAHGREIRFDRDLAPAFEQLYLGDAATPDRTLLVVPRGSGNGTTRDYLIVTGR